MFLLFLLILAGFFFKNTSDDSSRDIFRLLDLNERMLVANSLLTDFTVVKVFADAALVSDSDDWAHTASVANNVNMLN